MKKILLTCIALSCAFLFTGCIGKWINIGEEHGYCEENGCDYTDAGVCGDVYEIFKNKKKVSAVAYRDIKCNCAGEFNVKK